MSDEPILSSWQASWRAAGLLLVIDLGVLLAYFLVYYLKHLGVIDAAPDLLRIETQWGLGSSLMYLKWLALIVLLAASWRRLHQPLLLSLAAIFLFFLIDDALGVHEQLGSQITRLLHYRDLWGLRGNDFGKLTFWALAGSACLIVFIGGYLQSDRRTRRIGQLFLLGIAGLVLVGIGIDLVGVLAKQLDASFLGRAVRFGLRVAEDGGEMILASLLVGLAYGVFKNVPAAPGVEDWRAVYRMA